MFTEHKARDENPVVFTLYTEQNCGGTKKDVTYNEWKTGQGNGCYLTDGAYKSVWYNQWEVQYFTGGSCATRAAQSEALKCNGFQGDLYITGVKWRV